MEPVESQALHFMQERKQSSASWFVVYFNLSGLKQHNQTPLILENARIHIQKCLQGHEIQLFLLSNNDIVVFIQNIGLIKLEKFVADFRKFFADDPLTEMKRDGDHFYESYHLAQSFNTLCQKIESIAPHQGADHSQYVPQESAPVLPFELLIRLQNTLKQADISNYIRRQTICMRDSQDKLKSIGLEFYLSMEGIEDVINAHALVMVDFALFKYLSILFDKKMLVYLVRHVKMLDPKMAFHLNLNLKTVVSKEFFEFHKAINRQVVVEIDRTDMIWDMEGFNFAVDFLHSYKHKVCLDLLHGSNLKLFLETDLQCDYYKIICQETLFTNHRDTLDAFIRKVGVDNIILIRCDNASLIEKAKSMGLTHFQGFLVEEGTKEPAKKASY